MNDTVEWTDIGKTVLPEEYRDRFLAHLRGENTEGVDYCSRDGETPTWRSPNGSMAMSPGLALQSVVSEWQMNPTQVTYNMAWLAHDTTGVPGYFGDFSCTYQVLGVRTTSQSIFLLDGGVSITPILIVNDGPHEPIHPECPTCKGADPDCPECDGTNKQRWERVKKENHV